MGELTLVGGLTGAHVALRPVTPADVPALLHIVNAPELQDWRDLARLDEGWPLTDDSPVVRLTVFAGRRIAGMIQYQETEDPQDRHASLDIFLDPDLHGRGLGRDAVRTLARHLFDDRGHHRLVVEPAATNEVAIRCCAAVGFRPIGVMRAGERVVGSSRDGLVMDLLPTELR